MSFHILRLEDEDRGAMIAAPTDGFAMFLVEDVRHERTDNVRYNLPGVRDFVEGVPEEPGLALFRIRAGDLLGGSFLTYGRREEGEDWTEAPWERPWWPRLAADPRTIFIIIPEWECYGDSRTGTIRIPPPMPTEGTQFVDHYFALQRQAG